MRLGSGFVSLVSTAMVMAAFAQAGGPLSYEENEALFEKAVMPSLLRHKLTVRLDKFGPAEDHTAQVWHEYKKPKEVDRTYVGGSIFKKSSYDIQYETGEYRDEKVKSKLVVKDREFEAELRYCKSGQRTPNGCVSLGKTKAFRADTNKNKLEDVAFENVDYVSVLKPEQLARATFYIEISDTHAAGAEPIVVAEVTARDLIEMTYFTHAGRWFGRNDDQVSADTRLGYTLKFVAEMDANEEDLKSIDFKAQTGLSGDQVVDRLASIKNIAGLFTMPDGNGGDTTIKEHTLRVIHRLSTQNQCPMYKKLDAAKGVSTPTQLDFLKVVLGLHDIGKGEAASNQQKDQQHWYTMKYVGPTLRALDWTGDEIDVAQELIDNDTIGRYLRKEFTLEKAVKNLNEFAHDSKLSPQDYFEIQLLYFISDAGSYYALLDPKQLNVFDTTMPCWYPRGWRFYDLAKAMGMTIPEPNEPRPQAKGGNQPEKPVEWKSEQPKGQAPIMGPGAPKPKAKQPAGGSGGDYFLPSTDPQLAPAMVKEKVDPNQFIPESVPLDCRMTKAFALQAPENVMIKYIQKCSYPYNDLRVMSGLYYGKCRLLARSVNQWDMSAYVGNGLLDDVRPQELMENVARDKFRSILQTWRGVVNGGDCTKK